MKLNNIKLFAYLIVIFGLTGVSYSQIAIIVNKVNPIDDISLNDLKQMYLGQKTTFPNGKNVVLAEYADLKETFYYELFNWSLLKFRKHWMGLIFSSKISSAPKEFKRFKDLKEFINSEERAMAFVQLSEIDNSVKIITIDGKKPGSSGYPFN